MIIFERSNNKQLEKQIEGWLRTFNKSQKEWFRERAYKSETENFFAFDGEKLIGGAVGCVKYNWYYLDLLFVDEVYRNKKIGSQLLRQIEDCPPGITEYHLKKVL